uniref:Uncharacterized protein n=1 Tax=Rhizophora mucronata TaxID=61149 RepID=A0A2P2N1I1_RHIMU
MQHRYNFKRSKSTSKRKKGYHLKSSSEECLQLKNVLFFSFFSHNLHLLLCGQLQGKKRMF